MAVKNDGGPAFPVPHTDFDGMSLRDYFAGQALIGIMSGQMLPLVSPMAKERGIQPADLLARMCFEHADAMIKASEQ